MLKIEIPNNNVNEVKYIIGVIFKEFLGINFNISVSNDLNYKIVLPNNNILILNNAFFSKFDKELSYLSIENIPDKIIFKKLTFKSIQEIAIIYGDSELEISDNKIYCGLDIFASSFFMLTRWEEYVIKERDNYGRFPSKISLLQKHNIHYRAIVNEYVETLWEMLIHLGYKEKRKKQSYNIKITHDIDFFIKYNSFKKYIKSLGGDIIKRKNPLLTFKTTYEYINSLFNIENDPYYTYDFLMNESEKLNYCSTFFFMAGDTKNSDIHYSINNSKVRELIIKIKKKGHNIGLHGTIDSNNNEKIFQCEFERLSNVSTDIIECRQHFLKFENPTTWQIYNNIGIEIDNNMAYENDFGFRTGVCYSYPAFNIISRNQLNLIINPLIAMDSTYVYDKNFNEDDFLNKVNNIASVIKKYNGTMQLLWHNNNKHLKFIYKLVLDVIK